MDMQVDEDVARGISTQEASHSGRASIKGKGRQLHDEKRTATLHRIRFLDYMPSSILAIALTPQSYDPAVHHPYLSSLHTGTGREILAVGRQNGEIEIYTWIGGEGVPGKSSKNKQDKRRASISTPLTGTNKQGWVLERVSLQTLSFRHDAESFDHADEVPTDTDIMLSTIFLSVWLLLRPQE